MLGPLLWNIAYDAVLRVPMPPDSPLVCYADDTLVLVWGAAWDGIVRLAELAVGRVVAAIKGLGLRVPLRNLRQCGSAAGPITGHLQRAVA